MMIFCIHIKLLFPFNVSSTLLSCPDKTGGLPVICKKSNSKHDPPVQGPVLEVEVVLVPLRQERAAVMREHSSTLEPNFLMVSCT